MASTNSVIQKFTKLRNQSAARCAVRVDPSRPVWIFGSGGFGRSIAKVMKKNGIVVEGFIETNPEAKYVIDLPVLNLESLKQKSSNAQIVLGIFNRNTPYDQLVTSILSFGFENPLMPWDIYDQFNSKIGWKYWLSSRDDIEKNLERIAAVAEQLADQQSREILYRLCSFRLGLDLSYSSFRSDENQYFNEITLPQLEGRQINYVDCGAYNGDTYYELVSQTGIKCRAAYLMEPDPGNYVELVKNVSNHFPEAICIPLAAADKYGIMTFSSGQGEGGAIGVTGDISIAAVALDEMLPKTHVDLIKLDVEGAEEQVLNGATNLINRCRPVITLSLYHNPEDIWKLPEQLFELCHQYKFYIRQHYFNSFDSVLYAVPIKL